MDPLAMRSDTESRMLGRRANTMEEGGGDDVDGEQTKLLLKVKSLRHPIAYCESNEYTRELLVSTGISVTGWYFPRILKNVVGITQRDIPYQLLKSGDVVLDQSLARPYFDSATISSQTLIVTCSWIPMAFFILVGCWRSYQRRYGQVMIRDAHAGACALLISIGVSEFFTQLIKAYVGRLRPNFYNMCGFDPETFRCTASAPYQEEARQSFPSGHASLSFNGMSILALFFFGRSKIQRLRKHSQSVEDASIQPPPSFSCAEGLEKRRISAFVSVVLPISFAVFVSSSRLADNWHHPSDVIAGSLIGVFSATFSYHLFFPAVLSPNAGTPWREQQILHCQDE